MRSMTGGEERERPTMATVVEIEETRWWGNVKQGSETGNDFWIWIFVDRDLGLGFWEMKF